MSARDCPKCRRELPEETLRALEQGAACPSCGTRLKRTPRRSSTAAPTDNDYADFQVSNTPLVVAQPTDEDSYGWFQKKDGATTAPPAPSRSPVQSPATGGGLRPMPSISATPGQVHSEPAPVRQAQAAAPMTAGMAAPRTEIDKRPALPGMAAPALSVPSRSPSQSPATGAAPGLVSLTNGTPSPVRTEPAPVRQTQAATAMNGGTAVPRATGGAPGPMSSTNGTPSPVRAEPAPVRQAQAAAPAIAGMATARTEIEKRPASLEVSPQARPADQRRAPTIVGTAPPPAEKPSPPASVPAPIVPLAAEPPRAPLAMSAVLPAPDSTLALAPPLEFPLRSRRNIVIAVGAVMGAAVLGFLILHRSPADKQAPIAGAPPMVSKSPGGSAPLAALHETSRASPTIQPLHPETDTAPARHPKASPAAEEENAGREREAPARATPAAHGKVGTAHRATAHQRRLAKREKHEKRARHERRNARMQVASRATPSHADDAEARATYERGNALLFAGDAAGAVAAYRKAVELAPADPIGYRGLGLAYEQEGGTAAAIRALRKYLKLAPGAADREIISRRIARLSHGASHQ